MKDGVIDKFVTLLGFRPDMSGLETFKSGLGSVVTETKKLASTSSKTSKSITRNLGKGFVAGIKKSIAALKKGTHAIKKWKKDNKEQIEKVEVAWSKLRDKGSGLLGFLTKLTLGVTGVTGAFSALLVITNKETLRVDAMANSVRVSTEFLTAMGSVVEVLGFDFENVTDMVEEMNNKIGESTGLAEVTTPVKESLQILNLEYAKLKELAPEDQFIRILDAAKDLDDHQQAVSAVDMLMGGESNKIMGFLRDQKGSFQDLIEQRMALSFITQKGIQGAENFGKSFNKITFLASSLKREFFGLIGEGLSPLISSMGEWVAKNKELVKSKIVEYSGKVVDNVKSFVKWIKEAAPKIERFISLMGGLTGILNKVKLVLIAITAVKLVTFFGAMISFVQTLIPLLGSLKTALLVLASPVKALFTAIGITGGLTIGVAIALIAGLILIIQDLYTYFKGGDSVFGKWGEDLADAILYIQNHFEEVLDFIVSHFGVSLQEIKDFWFSTFLEIGKFLEYIPDFWIGLFDGFIKWIVDLPGRVANGLKDAISLVTGGIKSMVAKIPGVNMLFGIGDTDGKSSTKPLGESISRSTSVNNSNKQTIQQTNKVTIVAPQGSDPKAIAEITNKTIKRMFGDAASVEGVTQ